jgi:hypothetical protein
MSKEVTPINMTKDFKQDADEWYDELINYDEEDNYTLADAFRCGAEFGASYAHPIGVEEERRENEQLKVLLQKCELTFSKLAVISDALKAVSTMEEVDQLLGAFDVDFDNIRKHINQAVNSKEINL